jgi:hypothetical protein
MIKASSLTFTFSEWNAPATTSDSALESATHRPTAKRGGTLCRPNACMAVLLMLLAIAGSNLKAQTIVGSVGGVVTDGTGAAVPGATIIVVNVATNVTRTFTADSAGGYSVSALTPGLYQIRVQANGFQTFAADNVTVTPGAEVRVDAALQVGSQAQTVNVNAATNTLQTDSAEVRGEIDSTQLSNYPIPASRNYESALLLVPGITPPLNSNSLGANPSRGLIFQTNGAFGTANDIRIDGAAAVNVWLPHVAGYNPGLESIASVSVVTNSYSAQDGLAGGAAVNVHVKTGSNKFHGSLFEYHTDNVLTAEPFFLPAHFSRNPKDVDNALGGTIGGPILKDRVFFFFSYDGRFVSQDASTTVTVPTEAMRSGDFSGSSTPIYDPVTGTSLGAGKTAFANNQIPTARLDSIAQAIQQSVPLPNLPGIANNYFATGAYTLKNSKYDTDVTWKATSKLNVEARYGQLHFNDFDAAVYGTNGTFVNSAGGRQGYNFGNIYNGTASIIYVFNQNLVYNGYFTATVLQPNGNPVVLGPNIGLNLGIPGTNGPTPIYSGWPEFSISNFSLIGNSSAPLRYNDRDNQLNHAFTWTHKQHTIDFGANVERQILDQFQTGASSAGDFNFTGSGTTIKGGPGANAYNAYADFILGVFSSGTAERIYQDLKAKWFQYSLFAQDVWQVSPRLTLAYGLRWDYFPFGGRDHRGFERYNPANNTMEICGVAGNPHNCGYLASKLDFSPSLGLSYKLSPTFVVRAGGGLNRDPYPLTDSRDLLTNYPNDLTVTPVAPNGTTVVGSLETGLPAVPTVDISSGTVPVPSGYSVVSAVNHNKRDYVETWNLSLEKQWQHGLTTEMRYVGSRQVQVVSKLDSNAGLPGGGTASQPLFAAFGRTATTYVMVPVGRNQYDGLQTRAMERIGNNYTLNTTFTWSKTFAYCCDPVAGETVPINAPGYLKLNRGLAVFDRPYVFTSFATALLPFGKGQHFLTSGIPAAIAGGWQLSGILALYSGTPFSITASSSSLNAPSSTQIADRVRNGPCINKGYHGPAASYIDATCFAAVTTARFGNSGQDSVRGPGVKDLNATLSRGFQIREWAHLDVRAEVFNVTNTPHFANPGSTNISLVSFTPSHSVASLGGFGALSANNARDQEGVDQRFIRVGARLTF